MRAVDLAVAVKVPNGEQLVELKIGGNVQSKVLKETWECFAHLLQNLLPKMKLAMTSNLKKKKKHYQKKKI